KGDDMRTAFSTSALLLALSTLVRADQMTQNQVPGGSTCPTCRVISSRGLLPDRSLESGAIFELSLRVPSDDVENYLLLYDKWYFHVDVAEDSGRKLLTVFTREQGDEHNLVFLYWYRQPYKENYYCESAKAFFDYHLSSRGNDDTKKELRRLYREASDALGQSRCKEGQSEKCDQIILQQAHTCTDNKPPEDIGETIRKIDKQFRQPIVSDEASWNFGINPCKVRKLLDGQRSKRRVDDPDLERCDKSLLERSTSSGGEYR